MNWARIFANVALINVGAAWGVWLDVSITYSLVSAALWIMLAAALDLRSER